MFLWIESQDTFTITVIVFGFCYAMAVAIYIGAAAISNRRLAADLKATTPVMLTPLSVIVGLLIAFLASRVWANLDHANAYIAQEARAIRDSLMMADALPNG